MARSQAYMHYICTVYTVHNSISESAICIITLDQIISVEVLAAYRLTDSIHVSHGRTGSPERPWLSKQYTNSSGVTMGTRWTPTQISKYKVLAP